MYLFIFIGQVNKNIKLNNFYVKLIVKQKKLKLRLRKKSILCFIV